MWVWKFDALDTTVARWFRRRKNKTLTPRCFHKCRSHFQSRIMPPTPILLRGPGLPAFNKYFQPTTAGKDERFWRAAKSRTSLRNFLNLSEHL